MRRKAKAKEKIKNILCGLGCIACGTILMYMFRGDDCTGCLFAILIGFAMIFA